MSIGAVQDRGKKVRSIPILVMTMALAAASFVAEAQAASREGRSVTGQVTGIADGDTLYVVIDGVSTRVRLAQIDAPEKSQAFGRRSEQSLRDLVAKREVVVNWSTADRYGRPLVQVSVNGVDVNAEQVRRGFAWVYRRYSLDPGLIELETSARRARVGLWADPHPVAPWEWRKPKRGLGAHGS